MEKYRDRRLADRVFELAWTHSQVLLAPDQCHRSRCATLRAAGRRRGVCQSGTARRPGVLAQNRRGQSGLWSYSISGDLPIVLLQIADTANIELVRQLVQAQAYWRLKGLAVDLMIWNEDHSGYRQELHDQILGLISAGADGIVKDRPGGIFVQAVRPDRGGGPHPVPVGGARHPQRQPGLAGGAGGGRGKAGAGGARTGAGPAVQAGARRFPPRRAAI